jgi:hypothetical protein
MIRRIRRDHPPGPWADAILWALAIAGVVLLIITFVAATSEVTP